MSDHILTTNGMGYFWCSCDPNQAHVLWSLNEHIAEIARGAGLPDLCHEFIETGDCDHTDAEHDAMAERGAGLPERCCCEGYPPEIGGAIHRDECPVHGRGAGLPEPSGEVEPHYDHNGYRDGYCRPVRQEATP